MNNENNVAQGTGNVPAPSDNSKMATVKIKFRASCLPDKAGTLFYQVIHNRVVRQINTDYRLYPNEWNPASLKISCPAGCEKSRKNYLESIGDSVNEDVKRLDSIIQRLDRAGSCYTADKVVESFHSQEGDCLFFTFSRNLITLLKRIGKKRIAETYASTVNSFGRFRDGRDILLDEMDSELIMAYETYLASTGICPNSISFYMRNLRAIYNRAVDKELTVQRNPFKRVYTGIDKTVKRAVSLETVRRIRDLDLSRSPVMDYARDLFMFSFYTRGMPFVDMAFLRKKDLQNGTLTYRRHKTGQQLHIRWEKPMQEIVDKYDTCDTPYLLPVIKNDGRDERTQYVSSAHCVNRNLKKIGKMLGLDIPLTTYVARHGWASIAKSKNIPLSVISEAMGHDSETTTRIYLASLDTSGIDRANRLIIKSLQNGTDTNLTDLALSKDIQEKGGGC